MRKPPDWRFLADALAAGQDVEVLVTRDDNVGPTWGHYWTITGLELTDDDRDRGFDAGKRARILSVDPDDGVKTRELRQRANGRLYVIGATGNENGIRMAVEESPRFKKRDPIPAPASIVLLGAGLVAAAAARRISPRRRA